MPLEAGALLLDAIGLGAPLWYLTGKSIELLLWLAHTVGSAKGAVAMLASMPATAFAAIVIGCLWLCLWNGRVRLLGAIPFAIGAALAAAAPAPDLLVTGDGKHLAVVMPGGRPLLLRERSGEFVRSVMAESSGFDGEPDFLGSGPFTDCSRDTCVAALDRGGRRWHLLATRSADWIDWPQMVRACARADIAVSDRTLPRGCTPRWLKFDRKQLATTGAVAIYLGGKPRIDTVAGRVGQHPWATPVPKWVMSPSRQKGRRSNAAIRDRT